MILKFISVITCISCFLSTTYVLCNLTYFLSNHQQSLETIVPVTDENAVITVLSSILVDLALLSVFMLQHSVMATDFMKHFFCKVGIEHMSRSLYNVASAASLYLLLDRWESIPWVSVWKVDTSSNISLWLIFTFLHVLAWAIIYSGCLMLDISELAGIKQVYYNVTGRPSPMVRKSKDLLRYYAHMRHPSFTGFLIILWIHPFMTLDRLLLSSLLTIYMAMMWTIDEEDYNYHASIIRRKQRDMF